MSVNLEMIARNKLCLPPCKGFVEEYANEFQQLCSCVIKFSISVSSEVERFLGDSKKMLETKSCWILKEMVVLGGHQASHSLPSHH